MGRPRTLLVGGLLVVSATSSPLSAQVRASLETGFSYARFPIEETSTFGPSLRLTVRHESAHAPLAADIGTLLVRGGLAGGGSVRGQWRGPLTHGLSTEIGGEVAAVGGTESRASVSSVAGVRVSRALGAGGAWARAEGSVSRRELGALWGRGVSAGGWRHMPWVLLTATLAQEWSAGQLFATNTRAWPVGIVPVRYTEGSFGVSIEADRASLMASGTLRRDPDATSPIEAGGQASLALRMTDRGALVVGVASQLPDFVRGADAVQVVSVGFRVSDRRPIGGTRGASAVVVQVRGDSGARTLTVRAAGAGRIEVMGEFTGWEPLELARDGDLFAAPVPLDSGTHRMVVRIDGGPWRPAANTPAVDDDFGGRVGLLVVP